MTAGLVNCMSCGKQGDNKGLIVLCKIEQGRVDSRSLEAESLLSRVCESVWLVEVKYKCGKVHTMSRAVAVRSFPDSCRHSEVARFFINVEIKVKKSENC